MSILILALLIASVLCLLVAAFMAPVRNSLFPLGVALFVIAYLLQTGAVG